MERKWRDEGLKGLNKLPPARSLAAADPDEVQKKRKAPKDSKD
jgi:hypothetical protein